MTAINHQADKGCKLKYVLYASCGESEATRHPTSIQKSRIESRRIESHRLTGLRIKNGAVINFSACDVQPVAGIGKDPVGRKHPATPGTRSVHVEYARRLVKMTVTSSSFS
jgi:hypothetical protein